VDGVAKGRVTTVGLYLAEDAGTAAPETWLERIRVSFRRGVARLRRRLRGRAK
jgi:hypothetical protein